MDPAYLSSVALLSSFYEQKKNYFDVYLPFVIKALDTQAICNLEEVITNLKTVFHFGIPVNVLKTIINENEGKYFASHRKTSNWQIALSDTGKEFLSQIAVDERQMAAELSSLYQSIRTFCENIGAPYLNDNELSQSINAFLSSNLGKFLDWKVPGAALSNTSFDSMFVRYLFEIVFKDKEIENTIEKMWKGMVLLSTMSTNSGAKRESAFTQTLEIFVDTNVIFSLLGLHNPIFSRGISELFQLIARIPQIKVYIYDETLNEFDRILDVYDRIKGSFYDIQVDTVFYFLKKQGYDSSSVLSLKENIEGILEEKGIGVRSTRGVDEIISEYYVKLYGRLYEYRKERNDKLAKDMRRSEQQLVKSAHHDATVLSNVLLLKNKRTRNIQDAKALFLTSSGNLHNDYLRIARRIENYPCVIRDVALTNWLYIINPTSDGGPQFESILGMHSGRLFVDSRIWRKYISEVREMMSKETISPKQFALLVSNNKAVVDFLMKAEGDGLTEDAIRQVLEEVAQESEVREKVVKDAASEVQQLRGEIEALKGELLMEKEWRKTEQNIASDEYVRARIQKYTRYRLISLCLYLLFLAVVGGVYLLHERFPLTWLGLSLVLLPFLRSLIRHENVLETLKYCFLPGYRKRKVFGLESLYIEEYEKAARKPKADEKSGKT